MSLRIDPVGPEPGPPVQGSTRRVRTALGPRIVIADDHPAVAHSLSHWLGAHFNVLEPITSLQLLEPAVRIARPAILVADLDFAGVSALPILRRLVRDVPTTRVVVYSGADTEVAREMCLSAGTVDFVSKLDECERLLKAIRAQLAARHQPESATASIRTTPPVGSGAIRGRHDHGPLVRWLLRCGFPQRTIAESVGVSIKTVEYHSRRARLVEGGGGK